MFTQILSPIFQFLHRQFATLGWCYSFWAHSHGCPHFLELGGRLLQVVMGGLSHWVASVRGRLNLASVGWCPGSRIKPFFILLEEFAFVLIRGWGWPQWHHCLNYQSEAQPGLSRPMSRLKNNTLFLEIKLLEDFTFYIGIHLKWGIIRTCTEAQPGLSRPMSRLKNNNFFLEIKLLQEWTFAFIN